jgi:Mg2+-importing ATPase
MRTVHAVSEGSWRAFAFLDPQKGSAAKAIASLKRFGVATKILTGDNALVTRKVCKDVALDAGEIITGDQNRWTVQQW